MPRPPKPAPRIPTRTWRGVVPLTGVSSCCVAVISAPGRVALEGTRLSQVYTSVSMSVQRETSEPLRVLPRGRHAAPREVVAESQRERVLVAMADAVRRQGLQQRVGRRRDRAGGHLAALVLRALRQQGGGVPRRLRRGRRRAAGRDRRGRGRGGATAGGARDGGLLARAHAGTEVYLQLLADNPAFARTFLIEVLGAGPDALARRDAVHERFARADGRRRSTRSRRRSRTCRDPMPMCSAPRSARSTSW